MPLYQLASPVADLDFFAHEPNTALHVNRGRSSENPPGGGDDGVLVVGSGFTTHGLPFLTDWRPGAPAPGWSAEFDAWVSDVLARGAVDELLDFRHRAPGMPYAHPTVEHFAPLFVTLGLAADPESPAETVIDGFWMGLSKRSVQVA